MKLPFLLHTLSISSSLWNYMLITILFISKGPKTQKLLFHFISFLSIHAIRISLPISIVINLFFKAKLNYNNYYLAMLERFKQCFGCTGKE